MFVPHVYGDTAVINPDKNQLDIRSKKRKLASFGCRNLTYYVGLIRSYGVSDSMVNELLDYSIECQSTYKATNNFGQYGGVGTVILAAVSDFCSFGLSPLQAIAIVYNFHLKNTKKELNVYCPLRKTALGCPYGLRCTFAHNDTEARPEARRGVPGECKQTEETTTISFSVRHERKRQILQEIEKNKNYGMEFTTVCLSLYYLGYCDAGNLCPYAHHPEEKIDVDTLPYLRVLCNAEDAFERSHYMCPAREEFALGCPYDAMHTYCLYGRDAQHTNKNEVTIMKKKKKPFLRFCCKLEHQYLDRVKKGHRNGCQQFLEAISNLGTAELSVLFDLLSGRHLLRGREDFEYGCTSHPADVACIPSSCFRCMTTLLSRRLTANLANYLPSRYFKGSSQSFQVQMGELEKNAAMRLIGRIGLRRFSNGGEAYDYLTEMSANCLATSTDNSVREKVLETYRRLNLFDRIVLRVVAAAKNILEETHSSSLPPPDELNPFNLTLTSGVYMKKFIFDALIRAKVITFPSNIAVTQIIDAPLYYAYLQTLRDQYERIFEEISDISHQETLDGWNIFARTYTSKFDLSRYPLPPPEMVFWPEKLVRFLVRLLRITDEKNPFVPFCLLEQIIIERSGYDWESSKNDQEKKRINEIFQYWIPLNSPLPFFIEMENLCRVVRECEKDQALPSYSSLLNSLASNSLPVFFLPTHDESVINERKGFHTIHPLSPPPATTSPSVISYLPSSSPLLPTISGSISLMETIASDTPEEIREKNERLIYDTLKKTSLLLAPSQINNGALSLGILRHQHNEYRYSLQGEILIRCFTRALENNNIAFIESLLRYLSLCWPSINSKHNAMKCFVNSECDFSDQLVGGLSRSREAVELLLSHGLIPWKTSMGDKHWTILHSLCALLKSPHNYDIKADIEEMDAEHLKRSVKLFLESAAAQDDFNDISSHSDQSLRKEKNEITSAETRNKSYNGVEDKELGPQSIKDLEIVKQLLAVEEVFYEPTIPSVDTMTDMLSTIFIYHGNWLTNCRAICRSISPYLSSFSTFHRSPDPMSHFSPLLADKPHVWEEQQYWNRAEWKDYATNEQLLSDTPLHILCTNKVPNPHLIKFLLEHEANPLLLNNQGRSAVDIISSRLESLTNKRELVVAALNAVHRCRVEPEVLLGKLNGYLHSSDYLIPLLNGIMGMLRQYCSSNCTSTVAGNFVVNAPARHPVNGKYHREGDRRDDRREGRRGGRGGRISSGVSFSGGASSNGRSHQTGSHHL